MTLLPPVPMWEGLHVVVVHLPIGVALAAPVGMVLAMMLRGGAAKGATLATLAMVLVAVGGAFLAVATGEAAADYAGLEEGVGAVGVAYERHEELAELSRTLLATVGAFYAVWTAWRWLGRRTMRRGWSAVTQGVLLAAWLACCVVLANAAHEGGRLVHEFGIRAPIAGGTAEASPTAPAVPLDQDRDEDDD